MESMRLVVYYYVNIAITVISSINIVKYKYIYIIVLLSQFRILFTSSRFNSETTNNSEEVKNIW